MEGVIGAIGTIGAKKSNLVLFFSQKISCVTYRT